MTGDEDNGNARIDLMQALISFQAGRINVVNIQHDGVRRLLFDPLPRLGSGARGNQLHFTTTKPRCKAC